MDLLKIIDRVAEILQTTDIKEIKIKDGSTGIYMTKNSATTNFIAAPATANTVASTVTSSAPVTSIAAPKKEEVITGEELKSPMVGTFYASASPETPAYAKIGQEVKKGDVICIVEAMKIMNKIEAEKAGKIVKILAKDGEPVQFDQPLFIIE